MGPILSNLVLTPLNKMVMQNENIVTFLMLFAPFSFLPLFLSAFGVRPHSLLCTPLFVFLHQLHTTNHHLSFSMVKPLTTPLFGFLVVLALSLFLFMNAQSSSLVLVSVATVRRWPLYQMDAKNAFLNWDLQEEVNMQPLTLSPYDTALFVWRSSTGITLILLYVDDMILIGNDSAGIYSL